MKKLVIGDIVSRAWDLAVKHWPIFILLPILFTAAQLILLMVGIDIDGNALSSIKPDANPLNTYLTLFHALNIKWGLFICSLILIIALSVYSEFIIFRMYGYSVIHDKPYEIVSDAFKVDLYEILTFWATQFVKKLVINGLYFLVFFIFANIFDSSSTIVTMLGYIPFVYFSIRWLFVEWAIVLDHCSFVEAFSRSWKMTRGHFWELLLMGLTMIIIGVIGIFACCVGFIFAIVIIYFMLVVSFYVLSPEAQPATADEPAAPADYEEVQ